MDVLDTLNITASGLAAQRTRLQTISSNLANSNTTRTEEGGAYKRKSPVFASQVVDPFGDMLDQQLAEVQVTRTVEDEKPGPIVYDPDHPDADANGMVQLPNVDVLSEMVDLMNTTRSYEANTKVLEATRDMAMQAIDIGR
ncbi:MAG: flagellar basal body rod protein FlgC [Myxococcales bacterium]|nr:flagellar basal body rod protein FlgC [Myxococcales bacterium]MCA9566246.1 flagellar basal body rod protein FlgC [Myxococcales bacterium]MCB9690958.1 flagellar basal body rod protein FlgC [Alphaproteobacteria bacterium]